MANDETRQAPWTYKPTQWMSAKSFALAFSGTFEVIVGKGAQSRLFVLHKTIMLSRSPFFEVATSARWRTASSGPVALPDEHADIFELYLQFAYEGRVAYIHEEPGTWDDAKTEEAFTHMVTIYILADKLGDILTANLIIDELISIVEATKLLPSPRVEKLVYKRTSASSPLRRLLVLYLVHEVDLQTYLTMERVANMPSELVRDIMLEFGQLGKTESFALVDSVFHQLVRDRPKCYFHQHNERHPPCVSPTEWDVGYGPEL